MINVLLKWGTLLAIWKKYGSAIKALPILLIFIVIIYAVHGDYIEYAEVSDDKNYVAWSFLIKWLVIFAILAAYWFYVRSVLDASRSSSLRERMLKVKKKTEEPLVDKEEISSNEMEQENTADAFKNIRKKKHLRSKADVVLEKRK